MKVTETILQGVLLIEPRLFADKRGFFMESYNSDEFARHGIAATFVQDNHSLSVEPYVLRGLHYQLSPKGQAKLVRVTAGEMVDVVVDIRHGSPTFGQWASFILSADNKRQLYIPRGFAHGFCTVTPNTEVQYKADEFYSPEYERGIAWNDPILAIQWPTHNPVLSDKDMRHPSLADAEINYEYQRGQE